MSSSKIDEDKFGPNRQEQLLDRVGTYIIVFASIVFAILGAIVWDAQKLFEIRHVTSDDDNNSKINSGLGPIGHEGHVRLKPKPSANRHDKITPTSSDSEPDEVEGSLHCEKRLVRLDNGTKKVLEVCDWK